jgi:zinc protease
LAATLLAGAATLAEPALAQRRAAARAAQSPVPPLNYTRRVLPNGLTVYAMRDPRTSNVAVQMWYDVGSKDDPAGRSGFAHLFEHILSRVTRNISAGELSRIVEEQAGGTRNASTGPDYTMYRETVPANRLEAMIWAHAERMGRSVLDESIFEAERNIVQEEMRQNVLSQPYGRLGRYYVFDNAFTTHPYRRTGIGTTADLRAATLADARAFHENFYRPDNAVLVVSGNFDPAELNRYIDRHLVPIAKPARPILRFEAREAPRTEPRRLTAYAQNVPLPAVVMSWQRPRLSHPDNAALEVLQRILAGGQSSRLYRSLVYDRQLAQSATASSYGLKEAGIFNLQAIAASGRNPDDVEAALAAEVARVRDGQVTAAELAEAKTELTADTLFSRETAEGRAQELGSSAIMAGDPSFGDKQLAAIQRVTAADVQRVARTYLADNRQLTIRYLDESARTGAATPDPSAQPTLASLGRTLPPATGTPNTLAPEAERVAPPAAGPQQQGALPTFSERRLPNGMRVIVARSSDLPIVSAYVAFGGGAAADPADHPGLAEAMAGLVDNGAAGMTAPQIAAAAESIGASLGAGAGLDSSFALVAAPIANAGPAGDLLRAIVRSPEFAAEELERERRRSLDRLRVSYRQPGVINTLAARRALYGAAPYGSPTAGTPASLAALTREEIAAFHRRWWRPDNATMVITGAMDAEAGFAMAQRLFGDWTAPAEPLPTLTARAGQPGAPRVIVVDMPQADQAAVSVSLRGIPRNDPAYYPLLLANNVLGGSSTARLFQEVRVRRALSYGAYSNLQALRDEGVLIAQAQTRNDAAPEVANVMLGEIQRLAAEPVAADMLQRRQNLVSGAFARQMETSQGLSAYLAELAIQGLPTSEYGRYLASVQAVTPQQISAAVAAELDPARANIVIAGKASEFLPALRTRYPNVEVIPLAEFDPSSPTLRAASPAAQ